MKIGEYIKPELYLDYDMTMVDTHVPALDEFYRLTGIKLTSKDCTSWTYLGDTYGSQYNKVWVTPGMYNNVNPLDGVHEFLKEARKDWYPIIITSSMENMVLEKNKHIRKHFGDILTIHAHDKWKYTEGSPLVDDGPHNIIDHITYNSNDAIIFNLNNEYGWAKAVSDTSLVRQASNYNEVLNHLSDIRGKYV